jgi:phosphoenolpyruvate phosphomutase
VDSALAGADQPDRVRCDRPDTGRFSFEGVSLIAVGRDVQPAESHGVWMGLLHVGRDGADWLREAIAGARADGSLAGASLSDLLGRVLAAGRALRVVYTRGGWVNVNTLVDLLDASAL